MSSESPLPGEVFALMSGTLPFVSIFTTAGSTFLATSAKDAESRSGVTALEFGSVWAGVNGLKAVIKKAMAIVNIELTSSLPDLSNIYTSPLTKIGLAQYFLYIANYSKIHFLN